MSNVAVAMILKSEGQEADRDDRQYSPGIHSPAQECLGPLSSHSLTHSLTTHLLRRHNRASARHLFLPQILNSVLSCFLPRRNRTRCSFLVFPEWPAYWRAFSIGAQNIRFECTLHYGFNCYTNMFASFTPKTEHLPANLLWHMSVLGNIQYGSPLGLQGCGWYRNDAISTRFWRYFWTQTFLDHFFIHSSIDHYIFSVY